MAEAEIGVFGGSGFYSFLEGAREVPVETPFGPPSAPPVVGTVEGREVAFIPRHGADHRYPAHRVNYRANVWAMHTLGVRQILAPFACGSLHLSIEPGMFVVPDQLIDRTTGRADTFYDEESVHVSFAEPYCGVMRHIISDVARELGLPTRGRGTVCVVQGPRFSTEAECAWFAAADWSVVSMTPYPESILARELEICYANIGLVTNFASGIGGAAHTSADDVLSVFASNIDRLRGLLADVIPELPTQRTCACANALDGARP